MTTHVEWISVGGSVDAWTGLGFVVVDGLVPLHGTGVRIEQDGDDGRLPGLSLSGVDEAANDIDGVPVSVFVPTPPVLAIHPIGAIDIDHVVLVTDSLERTCGAVSDVTGAPLKRVREAGDVRQGFHRVGRLIVEVVERTGLVEGPAWLWGLVVNVDDLDAAVATLGPDLVGPARPAVQSARSIATVRAEAGIPVALALMSRAN